jgi:hypothetical protein
MDQFFFANTSCYELLVPDPDTRRKSESVSGSGQKVPDSDQKNLFPGKGSYHQAPTWECCGSGRLRIILPDPDAKLPLRMHIRPINVENCPFYDAIADTSDVLENLKKLSK